MSSTPPKKAPPKAAPTVRERTTNFLLYGFILSIALHVLLGPLVKFNRTPDAPEKVETVKIDKMPTPPPTPKPTPTPPPTPPPTAPPTPPPKSTPEPPKPKQIKINTLKTNAKSGGPSEAGNTHTEGSTNGVPQGSPTGAPTTAPVATNPPSPPTPPPTPPPTCAHPNVEPRTIHADPPETPPIAQQQGISGDVTVLVTLDENSKVVSAKIGKTASPLLNNAALASAKGATYQTRIENCKPIADSYQFIVTFSQQ
jgi:outer membrane biosynthesis protein TonB